MSMKNREKVIDYLKAIKTAFNAELKISKKYEEDLKYGIYDWEGCLNSVYTLMTGQERNEYLRGVPTQLAWYQKHEAIKVDGENFYGFIGDCVTEIIFNSDLKPEKKYNTIAKMIKDIDIVKRYVQERGENK